MEKLTKALMTDETGQAIVSKLIALSGQMHELAMATRGSAILFESESDISVLGDDGYLAVYVGTTNPLVISGWTGDNSLVTGHLYYLIKSGTAVTSRDLGEYGGTAVTDTTLSISGAAADAKATGDAVANINGRLGDIERTMGSAVDHIGTPVVLQNKTTSDLVDILSSDGEKAYITGPNIIHVPDMYAGSPVYNNKSLYIPFTVYVDFDVSGDFTQSQAAWNIYIAFKDGTKRYISYNSNTSVKKIVATTSNPIVEIYSRNSYITAGRISNVRFTLTEGEAYEPFSGNAVDIPASNVPLLNGTNVIWSDGGETTVTEISADGRLMNIEKNITNLDSNIKAVESEFSGSALTTNMSVVTGTQVYKDIDHNFKAGQRVSLLLSGDSGIVKESTGAFFIDQTNYIYLPYTKYNIPVEYTFIKDTNKIRCNIGASMSIGTGDVTFSITILPIDVRLSSSESRIETLENDVSPIVADFHSFDLPDYYYANSYIQSKVDRINALAKSAVGNGDVFVFITDEHWTQNAQKSPNLLRYIKNHCHIRNVFSGGDTGEGGSDAFCRLLGESWTNGKVHHVVGNHEYYNGGTNSNLYYMMNIENNDEIGNSQEHYYYVDNVQSKIRYIVLNSDGPSAYSSEQLTWFSSALNVENGWGIIILVHWMYMVNWQNDVVFVGSSAPQPFINAINNYEGNGKIIAIFQGHTHRDRITYTETSGVPVIITTCDKYVVSQTTIDGEKYSDIDVTREKGTITEQAFDVVIVNRYTKTLHLIRIGGLARNGVGDSPGAEVEERSVSWN